VETPQNKAAVIKQNEAKDAKEIIISLASMVEKAKAAMPKQVSDVL
jgi:hypothetical protein